MEGSIVRFDSTAPLANIRKSIPKSGNPSLKSTDLYPEIDLINGLNPIAQNAEKKREVTMKILFFTLMAIGLVISCAKKPDAQDPCGFVQNSEGQRVSWKSDGTIKLYFDPSVPTQFYQELQNAVNTWGEGADVNSSRLWV